MWNQVPEDGRSLALAEAQGTLRCFKAKTKSCLRVLRASARIHAPVTPDFTVLHPGEGLEARSNAGMTRQRLFRHE